MSEIHERLAGHVGRGYVLAPAGYGKTHLIALSVGVATGRQLVLTHTYAGVNVLRRKLRELQVAPSRSHTSTIAGFALRLCLSYPGASGFNQPRPLGPEAWGALYGAATALVSRAFIRRILKASFAGVFVDEYQDCTASQHSFVLELAKALPCRILGDPLQSIFDFDGQEMVDWKKEIEPHWEHLGELGTPHRWEKSGNRALGVWLADARQRLLRGEPIDVSGQSSIGIHYLPLSAHPLGIVDQANACRKLFSDRGSAVAMHGGDGEDKNRCHSLARKLGGRFASIEEVEGQVLFDFIKQAERAKTAARRLKLLVAFSEKCLTGVKEHLSAGTKDGRHVVIQDKTKNKGVTAAANAYLQAGTSANILAFVLELRKAGCVLFRADLFNRLLGVLKKHIANPGLELMAAAEKYQLEFRHIGRPIAHRRIVGTTLLVKGLEFDHAIVLDASTLSKQELYVALTRGARSLTVLSGSSTLSPK